MYLVNKCHILTDTPCLFQNCEFINKCQLNERLLLDFKIVFDQSDIVEHLASIGGSKVHISVNNRGRIKRSLAVKSWIIKFYNLRRVAVVVGSNIIKFVVGIEIRHTVSLVNCWGLISVISCSGSERTLVLRTFFCENCASDGHSTHTGRNSGLKKVFKFINLQGSCFKPF